MEALFLAWRDPHSRVWYPVGRLDTAEGSYRFVYLKGAQQAVAEAGFCPFLSFPNLHSMYVSSELFPPISTDPLHMT